MGSSLVMISTSEVITYWLPLTFPSCQATPSLHAALALAECTPLCCSGLTCSPAILCPRCPSILTPLSTALYPAPRGAQFKGHFPQGAILIAFTGISVSLLGTPYRPFLPSLLALRTSQLAFQFFMYIPSINV